MKITQNYKSIHRSTCVISEAFKLLLPLTLFKLSNLKAHNEHTAAENKNKSCVKEPHFYENYNKTRAFFIQLLFFGIKKKNEPYSVAVDVDKPPLRSQREWSGNRDHNGFDGAVQRAIIEGIKKGELKCKMRSSKQRLSNLNFKDHKGVGDVETQQYVRLSCSDTGEYSGFNIY